MTRSGRKLSGGQFTAKRRDRRAVSGRKVVLEDVNDERMTVKEVAVRALCLFGIWLANTPTPREEVILWLKNNDLWESLTPDELRFVKTDQPTTKQQIDFSWHIERLHVLSWALNINDEMAPPNEQGTIAQFQKAISPLNADTSKRFINSVNLRNEIEIWEMADIIEKAHWTARNAKIGPSPAKAVNLEIVQERHHAINWILWGREENWDDVNTDT